MMRMPITIRKKKKGKYSVRTPGGLKSRGTSKKKAMAQKRLLQGIERGWMPSR